MVAPHRRLWWLISLTMGVMVWNAQISGQMIMHRFLKIPQNQQWTLLGPRIPNSDTFPENVYTGAKTMNLAPGVYLLRAPGADVLRQDRLRKAALLDDWHVLHVGQVETDVHARFLKYSVSQFGQYASYGGSGSFPGQFKSSYPITTSPGPLLRGEVVLSEGSISCSPCSWRNEAPRIPPTQIPIGPRPTPYPTPFPADLVCVQLEEEMAKLSPRFAFSMDPKAPACIGYQMFQSAYYRPEGDIVHRISCTNNGAESYNSSLSETYQAPTLRDLDSQSVFAKPTFTFELDPESAKRNLSMAWIKWVLRFDQPVEGISPGDFVVDGLDQSLFAVTSIGEDRYWVLTAEVREGVGHDATLVPRVDLSKARNLSNVSLGAGWVESTPVRLDWLAPGMDLVAQTPMYIQADSVITFVIETKEPASVAGASASPDRKTHVAVRTPDSRGWTEFIGGSYPFSFEAVDSFGNKSQMAIRIPVDTGPPRVVFTKQATYYPASTSSIRWSFHLSEPSTFSASAVQVRGTAAARVLSLEERYGQIIATLAKDTTAGPDQTLWLHVPADTVVDDFGSAMAETDSESVIIDVSRPLVEDVVMAECKDIPHLKLLQVFTSEPVSGEYFRLGGSLASRYQIVRIQTTDYGMSVLIWDHLERTNNGTISLIIPRDQVWDKAGNRLDVDFESEAFELDFSAIRPEGWVVRGSGN